MYDYLAKIILLGPSGVGKYVFIFSDTPSKLPHTDSSTGFLRSCLLHRFVKNECIAACDSAIRTTAYRISPDQMN
jgi:hypothetical protein